MIANVPERPTIRTTMGAKRMGLANVEFREGVVEDMPVADRLG
jgi:hypothetical protein